MDKAPFFVSWKAIYLFVMIFFVVLTGLFYWFTATYSS
jgi:cytochrome c1